MCSDLAQVDSAEYDKCTINGAERTSKKTSRGMFISSESVPAVRRPLPTRLATVRVSEGATPLLRLFRARFLGGCVAVTLVNMGIDELRHAYTPSSTTHLLDLQEQHPELRAQHPGHQPQRIFQSFRIVVDVDAEVVCKVGSGKPPGERRHHNASRPALKHKGALVQRFRQRFLS